MRLVSSHAFISFFLLKFHFINASIDVDELFLNLGLNLIFPCLDFFAQSYCQVL